VRQTGSSYWPTRLHRLPESIPWLLKRLQIRAQYSKKRRDRLSSILFVKNGGYGDSHQDGRKLSKNLLIHARTGIHAGALVRNIVSSMG
jgi:hypothetical protein